MKRTATTIGTHAPKVANLVSASDEVISTLIILKTGNSSGPDIINNRILNELSVELAAPRSSLFNYSLTICKEKDQWKLFRTISKVMDKLIHNHVFNFLSENNMISVLQSGFVPNDSTVNQLIYIYHDFYQALDEERK